MGAVSLCFNIAVLIGIRGTVGADGGALTSGSGHRLVDHRMDLLLLFAVAMGMSRALCLSSTGVSVVTFVVA